MEYHWQVYIRQIRFLQNWFIEWHKFKDLMPAVPSGMRQRDSCVPLWRRIWSKCLPWTWCWLLPRGRSPTGWCWSSGRVGRRSPRGRWRSRTPPGSPASPRSLRNRSVTSVWRNWSFGTFGRQHSPLKRIRNIYEIWFILFGSIHVTTEYFEREVKSKTRTFLAHLNFTLRCAIAIKSDKFWDFTGADRSPSVRGSVCSLFWGSDWLRNWSKEGIRGDQCPFKQGTRPLILGSPPKSHVIYQANQTYYAVGSPPDPLTRGDRSPHFKVMWSVLRGGDRF